MATMRKVEVETLATVLANEGGIRSEDLGRLLTRARGPIPHSVAYETGRRRALPLVEAGALHRPRPGTYDVTEKGRIAMALLMSRDPALRAAFVDED